MKKVERYIIRCIIFGGGVVVNEMTLIKDDPLDLTLLYSDLIRAYSLFIGLS